MERRRYGAGETAATVRVRFEGTKRKGTHQRRRRTRHTEGKRGGKYGRKRGRQRKSDGTKVEGSGTARRRGTVEEPDEARGTDSPKSAEHDSLPLIPWPHVRATRTPSPQTLTFPPDRAGRAREATLRAGARGTIRHAVSPTAPASPAGVRARVMRRPERRSLWS